MTEQEKQETIKGLASARFAISKCAKCLGCERCSDLYFAGDNNCGQFRKDKEVE